MDDNLIKAGDYMGPDRRSSEHYEIPSEHLNSVIEKAIRETLSEVRWSDVAEHERHHEWIDAALKREADRAALRKAVMEKSLAGLVWAFIAFASTQIWNAITLHWKP